MKAGGAVKATGENEIEVHTDLPLEIFRAWKKYSDDFYEKYVNYYTDHEIAVEEANG